MCPRDLKMAALRMLLQMAWMLTEIAFLLCFLLCLPLPWCLTGMKIKGHMLKFLGWPSHPSPIPHPTFTVSSLSRSRPIADAFLFPGAPPVIVELWMLSLSLSPLQSPSSSLDTAYSSVIKFCLKLITVVCKLFHSLNWFDKILKLLTNLLRLFWPSSFWGL